MHRAHAFLVGTMRAAVKYAIGLDAVPDNLAPAMVALGREGVDGTFETIEEMRVTIHDDLDRLVIIVSAYFTLNHNPSFWPNLLASLHNSTGSFPVRSLQPFNPSSLQLFTSRTRPIGISTAEFLLARGARFCYANIVPKVCRVSHARACE
jgi:hypothetical protein